MTYRLLPLVLSLLLALSPALSPALAQEASGTEAAPEASILDLVAADARFSMLHEALGVAGLAAELAAEGPFTLFAPTDEAFGLLPEEELEALLNDQEALLRVLRYHVAEGLLVQENVLEVTEMTTLEGEQVLVTVGSEEAGGGLFVNEARIVESGMLASNGVVYAIDTVLLPPAPNDENRASY